jgi:transposase
MNKSNHFTGQPIFSQLIKLIPRQEVVHLARKHQSDRYYKKFKTYEHLVTMLYTILSKCSSLREVTTGLLACQGKLNHLGISYFPRRSTISDANCHRNWKVFEDLYRRLYLMYGKVLPDSRSKDWVSKLYIFDSTTISLFQEILKNAGRLPMNGKRKGGIKAHTLIRAIDDVPCLVRLTPAAAHDTPFMKEFSLPRGSIAVFDKGYIDYTQFDKWKRQGVSFVTRLRSSATYRTINQRQLSDHSKASGIVSDQIVELGHHHNNQVTRFKARLVTYIDPQKKKILVFLTNNFRFQPLTIAQIYKRRWQIEMLFKRLKQNYPLKYFLGDNENAIRIQIWCALIADLLLKYIRRQAKRNWAFSNLSSMIRLHLMNYISLIKFMENPEKAIEDQLSKDHSLNWSLFPP